MTCSPGRRSRMPSATSASMSIQASGAPSSPCRGAVERSLSTDLTRPIGFTINGDSLIIGPLWFCPSAHVQLEDSMTRMALIGVFLAGALLVPAAGFAQVSCSREGLQRAVDLYI